ncbi:hypothetical protein LP419_40730 [Massilia sp. H-1]|nr:hypothetical protein LP419_40730 [Massilia sp. H-1]
MADLIVGADIEIVDEIAFGDALGHGHGVIEWHGHCAGNHHGQVSAQRDQDQHGAEHGPARLMEGGDFLCQQGFNKGARATHEGELGVDGLGGAHHVLLRIGGQRIGQHDVRMCHLRQSFRLCCGIVHERAQFGLDVGVFVRRLAEGVRRLPHAVIDPGNHARDREPLFGRGFFLGQDGGALGPQLAKFFGQCLSSWKKIAWISW